MECLCIGRLNGKDRGKPLNEDWLADLDDARWTIEAWRLDYDKILPPSALGHLCDGLAIQTVNR
jgi:putative transposase